MSILIQATEEQNRQGVNSPAVPKLYGVPFISLVRDNGASATIILDGKRSNEERIVSESYASISALVNVGYIDSLISVNQTDGELVSLKTSGIVEVQEDQSGNSIIMYRDSEKQVDTQYTVTENISAILALIPTAGGGGISEDANQLLSLGTDTLAYLEAVPYTQETVVQVASPQPTYANAAEVDAVRVANGFSGPDDVVPAAVTEAHTAAGSPTTPTWWIYLGANSMWAANGVGSWIDVTTVFGGGFPLFSVVVVVGVVSVAGTTGGRALVEGNIGDTLEQGVDGKYNLAYTNTTFQQILAAGETDTTSDRDFSMKLENTRTDLATGLQIDVKGTKTQTSLGLEVLSRGSTTSNIGAKIVGVNHGTDDTGILIESTGFANNMSYKYIDIGDGIPVDLNDSIFKGISIATANGFSTTGTGELIGIDMNFDSGAGVRHFMRLVDGGLTDGKVLKGDANGNVAWSANAGLSETLTFGGGSTGDVATLTLENGIITAKTLVP